MCAIVAQLNVALKLFGIHYTHATFNNYFPTHFDEFVRVASSRVEAVIRTNTKRIQHEGFVQCNSLRFDLHVIKKCSVRNKENKKTNEIID